MKKLLPTLLIVVIVFNFILCNVVYADPDDINRDLTRYGGNETISSDSSFEIVNNGKDSSGNTFTHENYGISFSSILFQMVASLFNIFPITIQNLMSILTSNPTSSGDIGFQNSIMSLIGTVGDHFTIERVVFNDIAIFNIDVFNQTPTYKNGIGTNEKTIYQHHIILKIKESVSSWFYTIRLFATMINLCVLVFIGIRMVLSSATSAEGKYKKMLIWWAESLIILFLLHYIIYIIIYFSQMLLNIVNVLRLQAIEKDSAVSFEDMIINRLYFALIYTGGTSYFLYSIFFWFLTFLHIKFFFSYMKRTFSVMFLVVISPFITITFPIDKLDNGKAEAFDTWVKLFIENVFLQPIHAIVYIVFVFLAGKIAEKAPIVAMIFLLSLGRVENIIRNVFGLNSKMVNNVNDAVKGGKIPGIGGMLKMFRAKH